MGDWTTGLVGQQTPLALVDLLGRFGQLAVVVILVFVGVAVQFLVFDGLAGDSNAPTPDQKRNCPSCGARVAADAASCEYCNADIER